MLDKGRKFYGYNALAIKVMIHENLCAHMPCFYRPYDCVQAAIGVVARVRHGAFSFYFR